MNIRPGSVIEYETERQKYVGHRTARAIALVVRVERARRYADTRFHVITNCGTKYAVGLWAVTAIMVI